MQYTAKRKFTRKIHYLPRFLFKTAFGLTYLFERPEQALYYLIWLNMSSQHNCAHSEADTDVCLGSECVKETYLRTYVRIILLIYLIYKINSIRYRTVVVTSVNLNVAYAPSCMLCC